MMTLHGLRTHRVESVEAIWGHSIHIKASLTKSTREASREVAVRGSKAWARRQLARHKVLVIKIVGNLIIVVDSSVALLAALTRLLVR